MEENTKPVVFGQQYAKTQPTEPEKADKTETPKKGSDNTMEQYTDPKHVFDYSQCHIHTVQKGETLLTVAQKYRIAVQQLRYFNHVNKSTFKVKTGQKLAIPDSPIDVPVGA